MAPARDSKYDILERERESKYGKNYKWIALSNTTLGALLAGIDTSIVIISLPAIFNGLGVNPLLPANIGLLLWLLLGYLVVTSVMLVTIGRLSDMFGRVKLYNLGFVIFAIGSVLLYVSSLFINGTTGALALIAIRLLQAFGASFLFANSAAIITDAFPLKERGMALGINQIAIIGGSIVGLIAGGILAAIDWHLIFLVSVPVSIIGAVWAYLALKEVASIRKHQKMDILGNVAFAIGITLVLLGLTYALLPFGGSSMGWSNPSVLAPLGVGAALLIAFIFLEIRTRDAAFNLKLFGIPAFSGGILSMLLAGIARGGLQFMLILWLQGIWLPTHGISYSQTPFWSAIYLIPLSIGFLLFGPICGYLSDKYGTRIFTTGGMLINVVGFLALAMFPASFNYLQFAIVVFILGAGQGMFTAPNTSAIMSSVPPENRGSASGMRATIMNSSLLFSISIFFTVLILGLSALLPSALVSGFAAQGVPYGVALNASHIPPISALFASLLGYNPVSTLIPAATMSSLPAVAQQAMLGNSFFAGLISGPFIESLKSVMYISAFLTFIAALASWFMVKKPRKGEASRLEYKFTHLHV